MKAGAAAAYPCEGGCGTAMDIVGYCDDCALDALGIDQPKIEVALDSGSNGTDSEHVDQLRNADSSSLSAAVPQSSVVSRSSTTEKKPKKKGPELGEVEWLLREEAVGNIKPVWYPHPDLPGWATEPMKVIDGFYRRVRGVRLWAGDERPVLFTLDWIVKHTDLPKSTVHRALGHLVEADVLVLAEKLPNGHLRPLHCYDPGPVKNVVPLHGVINGGKAMSAPEITGEGGLRAIDGGRKVDTCRCDPPRHSTDLDEDGVRYCLACSKRREPEVSS